MTNKKKEKIIIIIITGKSEKVVNSIEMKHNVYQSKREEEEKLKSRRWCDEIMSGEGDFGEKVQEQNKQQTSLVEKDEFDPKKMRILGLYILDIFLLQHYLCSHMYILFRFLHNMVLVPPLNFLFLLLLHTHLHSFSIRSLINLLFSFEFQFIYISLENVSP